MTTMAYKSRDQITFESEKETVTPKTEGKLGPYTTLEYPIGTLGYERHPHYVIFFINESEKSKFIGEAFTPAETAKIRQDKTANTSLSSALVGSGGEFKQTSSGNTGVDSAASHMKDAAGKVANEIKGVVKQWSNPKKRLKNAICLPMPQKIRANYNAGYQATDEVGAFGAVIAAAISPGGDASETLLRAATPAAAGMATEVARSAVAAVPIAGKGVAGVMPSGADTERVTKQIQSKLTGQVFNRRQEQLFQSMEFRAHSFSYLFIPRTEEESNNINEIIKQFKLHMHPELNAGNGSSLLITPAEFDIEFRNGGSENAALHKIATCALMSLDVNYTAIGEFVAFKGTDNPVAISLDLTFVEMEPLHREMIMKGY